MAVALALLRRMHHCSVGKYGIMVQEIEKKTLNKTVQNSKHTNNKRNLVLCDAQTQVLLACFSKNFLATSSPF